MRGKEKAKVEGAGQGKEAKKDGDKDRKNGREVCERRKEGDREKEKRDKQDGEEQKGAGRAARGGLRRRDDTGEESKERDELGSLNSLLMSFISSF